MARWNAIHVGLNAAGIPGTKRMLARDGVPCAGATFARTLAVNPAGSFHVMAHCASGFAANDPEGGDGERGGIVNVSPIVAHEGDLGHAAYAASRAGVIGMMRPAARELAPLASAC